MIWPLLRTSSVTEAIREPNRHFGLFVCVLVRWLKVGPRSNVETRRTTINAAPASTQLFVDDTPITLLLEGDISPHLQGRFVSLFRSVWDRIPRNDQNCMLVKAGKHEDGLRASLSRATCERTNGWASSNKGQIWFDAWFVEAATDRNAKSLIAHELGHWRGYADSKWPNDSEAVACLYAERIWGFRGGDVVFKSQMCLRLDEVVREVGLKAQVFQCRTHLDGEPEDTFLLLPKGKRLDFDSELKLDRIGGSGDDFEIMAAGLRSYIR